MRHTSSPSSSSDATPVKDKVSPSNQIQLGECDGLQDAGINQSSTNNEIIQANENFRDCAINTILRDFIHH
jgi:hypothetical protein